MKVHWLLRLLVFCALLSSAAELVEFNDRAQGQEPHGDEVHASAGAPHDQAEAGPHQQNGKDEQRPWREKYLEDANWWLVLAAFSTLGVVVWQTVKTHHAAEAARKAANATLRQAEHLAATERPFVMIEARGADHVYFWAVNHGRSPAQIIFSNPVPVLIAPLKEELPEKLFYGVGYDNPHMQQINVQWIPPKGEHPLGDFDPEQITLFSKDVYDDLLKSRRVLLIFGAFKYKGIASEQLYTSTYCYRRGAGRVWMWGGYGWNQYT